MQTRMSERKRTDSLNDRNPLRNRRIPMGGHPFPPAPVRCHGNRRKLQGIARASLFGGQFGAAARFHATMKAVTDAGLKVDPATVAELRAEGAPGFVQATDGANVDTRPEYLPPASSNPADALPADPTMGTGVMPPEGWVDPNAAVSSTLPAPDKFACLVCGKEFNSAAGVRGHQRAHKAKAGVQTDYNN